MRFKTTFPRISVNSFWPFFNLLTQLINWLILAHSLSRRLLNRIYCLLIWDTQIRQHIHTCKPFQPLGLSFFLCVSLLFSFVIHPNQSRAHFPKVVVSILAHWGSTLVPFHWDTLHWDTLQPLHYPDRPLILNSTRLLSPCLCDLRCTGIHLWYVYGCVSTYVKVCVC